MKKNIREKYMLKTKEVERLPAIYLNLRCNPYSTVAMALTIELAYGLGLPDGPRARPQRGPLINAMGALLAGILLGTRETLSGYSYRCMSAGSFTGEHVGYRPFMNALDRLLAGDLLEIVRGTGGGNEVGQATRFRAKPALRSLAARYGIRPQEWGDHFRSLPRPTSIPNPLVLKSSSRLVRGQKRPGASIPVKLSSPMPTQLGEQVNQLNSFFAGVKIEPDPSHHAFQRVFNLGDTADFNWNKGGRLISMGASYQQMKRLERQEIRLNGEPTVEIDIRASHLTILHLLRGVPLDPTGPDPYAIPELPRPIVKAWVTMTLGHDRFQIRWSQPNKARFKEEYGDLQKAYPIASVKDRILKHLPVLQDWTSSPIRWGDLQFIESRVIVDTVHDLAVRRGIPALPVHDSIIVPASAQAVAEEALSAWFKQHVGCRPCLSAKT